MKQEYKVAKPIRIIFGLVLAGIFCYAICMSYLNFLSGGLVVAIVPLIVALICVLSVINQAKTKVIITDKNITYVTLFSTKQLALEDIAGFRVDYRKIIIESAKAGKPNLVVNNYINSERDETLLQWVEQNLTDLSKT